MGLSGGESIRRDMLPNLDKILPGASCADETRHGRSGGTDDGHREHGNAGRPLMYDELRALK
jgi:hypothetical protein